MQILSIVGNLITMPTSPRFVLALKSMISSRKHASATMPMLTPSCSATSAIISLVHDIQHTYNELKTSIMYIAKEYIISNKSQSEILFLTSILLAVLLFAIILPTYEALFGSEEDDVVDDDQYNIISSSRSRIIENKEVSSPKPLRRTSNLMYKPGVGVVEVIYEEPPLLRLSSDGSTSDQSLTGSMCSHFSDLETIEESEEEYLQDEDTNDDNNLMPQLDTTIEEEDDEEDQLLEILEEEPKEPDDYVKYYEYLVLQGLSLQGS